MHKKIAFLFPGQGAQYAGMGKDFYEAFAEAREVFQEADELLGKNFSKLMFEGEPAELTATKNSQLAIYIMSAAILRVLEKQFPDLEKTVCAGLSLGEYTALHAAGRLSFAEGLLLVKSRSAYMQAACDEKPGSMRVVLGLEHAVVIDAVASMPKEAQVFVANLNSPGQVVIAGNAEGLDSAALMLKEKGAKRVLPLDVSGAFHTSFMQSAKEKLAPMIKSLQFTESEVPVVMNVAGDYVSSNEEMKQLLIDQVTSPVLWEKGVRAMMKNDIDLYLEIGPGSTLSGMNRKIGVTSNILSIQKVADLEEFAKTRETACKC